MQIEISITAGPAKGHSYKFARPDCLVIGRAADAHVSLPADPYLSRRHCVLEIAPPDCRLTDLDSKNGVVVNGVRYGGRGEPGAGVRQAPAGAREVLLRDGDRIDLGDTRLLVSLRTKAGAAPAGPVCVRCKADVGAEAGARGRAAGAEYVCRACRERENGDPLSMLQELLDHAEQARDAGAPELRGYRIVGELAGGGMGKVFRATELRSGRAVVIKTMQPRNAADPDRLRQFQREIDVTRQLDHANVVRLLCHGNAKGTLYFVLEFVDGMDFNALVKSKGGKMPLEEAAPILMGSLAGLAHAHAAEVKMKIASGRTRSFTGIVHRDIKPQNILLQRDGARWIPKIADFGLAKSFESAGLTDLTIAGAIAGTPYYWPREQIIHYRWLSPATDVFSMAAVFYEALTGLRIRDGFPELFEACRKRARTPGLPDFMRLIAENPVVPIRIRRPQIPAPVAEVFDHALGEGDVPADHGKMRRVLAKLRYPDAGAFRSAMAKALTQAGVKW